MNLGLPTKLPQQQLGSIHFIGIGGIGMSGIAEVLINHGYQVQGSDIAATKLTQRLELLGARTSIGHSEANIADAEVVVVSSAIKSANPELREARRRRLPIVRRAEMLAELMRLKSNIAIAGTHGKTTTTTIVATLLDQGGFDPTVVNGGIIHAYESNARLGAGAWMVVEADESDGTFVKLPATIAIVTNIDPEHLDHYGSFKKLRQAFDSFVSNIPFYGFAVCCIDHPEVRSLVQRITDRRIVTYGFDSDADIRATGLSFDGGNSRFDVIFGDGGKPMQDCFLPMPGEHNVSNALAAIAVASRLGMPAAEIKQALAGFAGVNRRFTKVGEVDGVTIIDDYAHHPVEIAAVLKAARSATAGRIIAIHQPHRFTRLSDLFDDFCTCFDGADAVAIADVYAAGEKAIPGADRDALVLALNRRSGSHAVALDGPDSLVEFVRREARQGDFVVCLGAGSISAWANGLPEALRSADAG
ncbi:MAG: UDP-N-acetylmuramate--L-alanine ligase [Rhodobacteraceae bacterium]|nr:UDP-N-acetylmuramate--L-alanine ligase [Paracoccaceae bacterium]